MTSLDRLSALMERFELKVSPTSFEQANFVIVHCKDNEWPKWLFLTPKGHKLDPVCDATDVSFSAHVSWGGESNPFFSALNELVKLEIDGDSDIRPLIELLLTEYNAPRCGSSSVLSRLSEILVVGLLRKQIQQGATSISLLGGLADKRLSRAIVAVHDAPGKMWSNEELAEIAGLSISRFSEIFKDKVGETPAAYIRKWRLTLARQDLSRGDRVQEVAHRYCYNSPEALNHAFKQAFGVNPSAIRNSA